MFKFIASALLMLSGAVQTLRLTSAENPASFEEFFLWAFAPTVIGFALLLFDNRGLDALANLVDWMREKGPRLSTVVGWLTTAFFAGWAISWPTHNAITALVAIAIGSFTLYRSYHHLVVSQTQRIWHHKD